MVAPGRDRCEGFHRRAAPLLPRTVVDVVRDAARRERHAGVGRERGRKPAVVDTAIRPFRMAGAVVRRRPQLGVRWAPPGERGDLRRLGGRCGSGIRRPRVRCVSHVGRERLHLGDAERLAQAVGKHSGLEFRIGVERAVAPTARRPVIDEPRAEVEAVVEGIDVIDAALRAEHLILLARAAENRDLCHADIGPVLRRVGSSRCHEAVFPRLLEIHFHGSVSFLDERENPPVNRPRAVVARERGTRRVDHARWKMPAGTLVVVDREHELADVALATGPSGRLAGALHGRQEHADERADDRDHDQQFHERERSCMDGWTDRITQKTYGAHRAGDGLHMPCQTADRGMTKA